MSKQNDEYTFSVIVPIYNVEQYLEEAITSLTDQTIGFNNIQLILVNDGSPDESYKICERYQAKYPDNILYIKKENGGVSSARNEGLKYIKGKYVVFLDGDDIWESKAFSEAAEFFDEHYDEIDLCSCRMKYFGDFETKTHPLNFKFKKGKRVVSLDEKPNFINTTLGNVVFKAEALRDKRFNEYMKYGEDSFLVNTILAEKRTVGIVPDAVFCYRKNRVGDNASVKITKRRSWYFDVPRNYYLGLLNYIKEHYGYVPDFIQQAVFYDMKWRNYNADFMANFTEEEKEEYLGLLKEALQDIDDNVIMKSKKVSTFKKLYFLNLKHGKNILDEATLNKGIFTYKGQRILNLKARQMVEIRTLFAENGRLNISGMVSFSFTGRPYTFFVTESSTGDTRIMPDIRHDKKKDVKGIAGEWMIDGEVFNVALPVNPGSVVSFYVDIDGETVKLNPKVSERVGLSNLYNDAYNVYGDYIIQLSGGSLHLYKYNLINEMLSNRRFLKTVESKSGKEKKAELASKKREESRNCRARLKKQVAFVTIRSDNCLLDNMERVYEMLDVPKVMYAKRLMGYRENEKREAKKIMSTSKVVVTDDYLFLMKNKKKGQKYIQLWHATGAGKHFGQDASPMILEEDASYHRNYNAVTVSSERIKDVYASAFAIPVDRIAATGVARTDLFFDEKHIREARDKVYDKYPQLKGKSVILFTPTFRDLPGISRAVYDPHLDFDKLSATLKENQVFIVRPHPVMIKALVGKEYPNIIEIKDVNTNDLMLVSDLLVSDYSSTMFEYSLLKKPMAFYCYDFDDYDRDFYLDFEKDLPGPLLRTEEEFLDYLSKGEYPLMESFEEFYQRFMGACDGHSTERIVELIKKMLDE